VRVVAFRHSPVDGLGWIARALEAHGFQYEYADLFVSPAVVSEILGADAFIFLGGSMSANDDLPAIHREIEYIQDAITLRKPVLGVCLGAQLIAKALGARVYPNTQKEIGWAPVVFTDAAPGDPETNRWVWRAKLLAGETAMDVAASMLEAAGTSATRRGSPLERIFRDARCGSLQPATSDVCADWLGAAALGDDPEAGGRW